MERVLSAIERIAGLALAVVAGLIFLTAILRYVFSVNLPDGFDFSRYLQGIAILWGLALATYHRSRITVDLVWETGAPWVKRVIDVFAAAVTAVFFIAFAYVLLQRLPSVRNAGEVTNDLHLAVWPFYLAAICGVATAALVAVVVLLRSFTSSPASQPHG